MKVLFLITELQNPVGGLHRFATELLPVWRESFRKKEIEFEPVVLSLKDKFAAPGDLVSCSDFKTPENVSLFEGVRGGEKCYFLQSSLDTRGQQDFQKMMWDKFRIKSMKHATWAFYQQLISYWSAVNAVYPELSKKHDIALVDAQDWLAFPAGFLLKKNYGLPLHCRFHSGEFGRAMGKPDPEAPPLTIETAAFQEADFIQAVSVSEMRFELYRLLELKEELSRQFVNRGEKWLDFQEVREQEYQDFLLTEQTLMELSGKRCAGLPNGIILDSWLEVSKDDVEAGKKILSDLLPEREKVAVFIGRPAKIKGIYSLLDAFKELDKKYGLVILSHFTPHGFEEFMKQLTDRGVQEKVVVRNGWVDERLKKQVYCASDVIVLPSLYEPFGLVTLEALAADLACERNGVSGPIVVVGDTGGMHETIENGVNGFKVPMEEDVFDLKPAFLADVLKKAFKAGELKTRISKKGAERIESEHYRWHNILLHYAESYRKTIENSEQEKKFLA
ncbi:MAG: glycosyltransferase family 4 protein [Candidatus Micrarchaeota archaeon]